MNPKVSRRLALRGAVGAVGAALVAALPRAARSQSDTKASPTTADLTGRLARYMADARMRALPERVVVAAKQRVLDTLAAIVSGARLAPGKLAIDYVRTLGGTPEACVATTSIVTTAVEAAFANAMCAHADETDDFHPAHESASRAAPSCRPRSRWPSGSMHPVPRLIAAVVLGYDVCCRFLMALGPDAVRASEQSAEGVSSTFGAAAAAASIAGFDERRDALRDLVRRAASVGRLELGARRGARRESVRFRGHGRSQRRDGCDVDGAAGFTGVADVARRRARTCSDAHSPRPSPDEIVAGARHAVLRRPRLRSRRFRSAIRFKCR